MLSILSRPIFCLLRSEVKSNSFYSFVKATSVYNSLQKDSDPIYFSLCSPNSVRPIFSDRRNFVNKTLIRPFKNMADDKSPNNSSEINSKFPEKVDDPTKIHPVVESSIDKASKEVAAVEKINKISEEEQVSNSSSMETEQSLPKQELEKISTEDVDVAPVICDDVGNISLSDKISGTETTLMETDSSAEPCSLSEPTVLKDVEEAKPDDLDAASSSQTVAKREGPSHNGMEEALQYIEEMRNENISRNIMKIERRTERNRLKKMLMLETTLMERDSRAESDSLPETTVLKDVEEANPDDSDVSSTSQTVAKREGPSANSKEEALQYIEEMRNEAKSKNMVKKERRREQNRLNKMHMLEDPDFSLGYKREKRKADEEVADNTDIKKAKLETKALKAKRPGFSEERYNETSYFIENGLRKVYPYYFTFTTFTKGRWVGEKILDVFAKEFRAHPAEEYERCIKSGTLTVNYERVETDCRLKHNDLLANIVHRHEVPVTAARIPLIYTDDETVVVDKPASIPVHPCGRYRHNTVVFILAKEYNLKNLRTIHRLDRLTSGLLLFGRTPKKAREMEQQIRTRQVTKQYLCRVEGHFPPGVIDCNEPIEVVSYKIGVCKVSPTGKDCKTEFQLLSYNGTSSVVLCKPRTGRMHQIRVHLQYLGYPIVNDPLYNHLVFGPNKGKGGVTEKSDEQLISDLIKIHNAENWLGMDGDVEYSMFNKTKDAEDENGSVRNTPSPKDKAASPPTPRSALPTPSPPAPPLTPIIAAEGGHGSPPGGEDAPNDQSFKPHLKTVDKNCYECKVRYRDPKPKDLVMYLHALKYSGPGWSFETKMPPWASADHVETEELG